MQARVAARERGICAARYAERVRQVEQILDGANPEHFSIHTGDAPGRTSRANCYSVRDGHALQEKTADLILILVYFAVKK